MKKKYRKIRPLDPKKKTLNKILFIWISVKTTPIENRWCFVTDGRCVAFAYYSDGWVFLSKDRFYSESICLDPNDSSTEPLYEKDIVFYSYVPELKKGSSWEPRPL